MENAVAAATFYLRKFRDYRAPSCQVSAKRDNLTYLEFFRRLHLASQCFPQKCPVTTRIALPQECLSTESV
jgi:hypothetical protein